MTGRWYHLGTQRTVQCWRFMRTLGSWKTSPKGWHLCQAWGLWGTTWATSSSSLMTEGWIIDDPQIGTLKPFRNKMKNSEGKAHTDISLRALDCSHRCIPNLDSPVYASPTRNYRWQKIFAQTENRAGLRKPTHTYSCRPQKFVEISSWARRVYTLMKN